MKVLARVLTGTALAAGLFSPVLQATSAFAGDDTKVQHVLLLSVDGFHAVDLAVCIKTGNCPNLEKLTDHGFTYTNASTTTPSDSFPGLMAQITGGTSKSTAVRGCAALAHPVRGHRAAAAAARADWKNSRREMRFGVMSAFEVLPPTRPIG